MNDTYEAVIGLEVHAELKTATKLFCSCPTTFGAAPNTAVCPICMGLPGTLPVLNRAAVDAAIVAGLVTNCTIALHSGHDRKNYFYPDMPKAYQITQYRVPLCRDGFLTVETANGTKRIGIARIHIEEDAGKLLHTNGETRMDLNRCGVPLIEIVSEPELRSAEEAKAYLKELRSLLLCADISDCRMNEGSLRCDVNLSVRRRGETALGTRTEIKNLNSISFVGKAIEFEFQRQIDLLRQGKPVRQETRRFDQRTGQTVCMRAKENAEDYRYFPEPDLPPITVTAEQIERLRRTLPPLPSEKKARYVQCLGLTPSDAAQLASDPALSAYFDAAAHHTDAAVVLAHLILSELLRLNTGDPFTCPIAPLHMGELATLLANETINSSTAKRLVDLLWKQDQSPVQLVREQDLAQINDSAVLLPLIREAIAQNPKAKADYQNGKRAAAKVLVGAVMAKTHGKANPTLVNPLIEQELNRE